MVIAEALTRCGVRRVGARDAMAVVVVALIAAGTVLSGSLGGEALARVERSVQSDWRPVYDLIVVPRDVDLAEVVGGERVLQANFMSSLPGGITFRQWRDIRALPGVDVAAPIANVGYFARSQNSYHIDDLRHGVYSVDRKVWWNSGLDRRLMGHTSSTSVPEHSNHCREDPPLVIGAERGNVAEKVTVESSVTGYTVSGTGRWTEHPAQWQCLGLDPGGVFTVAAVDPGEEQRLLGLDDAVTQGGPLRAGMDLEAAPFDVRTPQGDFDVQDLPLLLGDTEWVDSDVRLRFSRWRTGPYQLGDFARRATTTRCARRDYRERYLSYNFAGRTGPPRCIDRELQRALAALPRQVEMTLDLPSPGGRALVEATHSGGRWTQRRPRGLDAGQFWVARTSRQSYEPAGARAPRGEWLGALRAVPTGSYGPEPTFREQVPAPESPFLRYNVVGHYDPAEVAAAFAGQEAWLPEGTYQVPRAVARYDDHGRPRPAARLRPTGNPLGYLVQPPQALTTLTAARHLVGNAPISAIRVRLTGVDFAGEDSWQRIEDAVRRIREATGLQVLVTAGSAPAKVLVNLPGISAADQPGGVQAWQQTSVHRYLPTAPAGPARTVKGFGWVEERWLIEGAAVDYLRAGATSHLWLLGIVTAAGLVYLAAAFLSLGLARIPQIAIRRAVGWTRLRVFLVELRRAVLLGLCGAVLGTGLGVVGSRLAGLDLNPPLVIAAVPAAVAVCALAALWPAWRVSGVPLAAALSGTEVAVSGGTGRRRGTTIHRVSGLAIIELWRLRTRSLLALLAGTVAVAAILTLTFVRDQFAGSLQVTLLGQEVLVATGPLQQAGTGVAVALAVLLLAELLWQAVRDRRRELGMLRAVGWGRRHVMLLMVWQGILLGCLAAVLGALATSGLLAVTIAGPAAAFAALSHTLPWASAAGILLGAIAAGVPAWAASRVLPAESLRAV